MKNIHTISGRLINAAPGKVLLIVSATVNFTLHAAAFPRHGSSFSILIENRGGGRIELISKDTSFQLASVITPVLRVNPEGYQDAARSRSGEVVATAANAVHIKVGQSLPTKEHENGRAILFSLLPKEFRKAPGAFQSYKDSSSSLIADISAGTLIFAEYAPFVGSKVFMTRGKRRTPIPDYYFPQENDLIEIIISEPPQAIRAIEFENKFQGKVTTYDENGKTHQIAAVYKPVMGVGRFDGSIYIGQSRVRANHHGVIDISLVPRASQAFTGSSDNRGGFQIIPSFHAMDDEMLNARLLTQWMIVGPVNSAASPIDGTSPLFRGYLRPGQRAECRIDGGPWESFPEIHGKVDDAFAPQYLIAYFRKLGKERVISKGVTHIRILLD